MSLKNKTFAKMTLLYTLSTSKIIHNYTYMAKKTSFWDDEEDDIIIVKDANWHLLADWDSVVAVKDIKVKWASDIKRGDKFSKIRLTDDAELIESWKMVLRTEFFKKV